MSEIHTAAKIPQVGLLYCAASECHIRDNIDRAVRRNEDLLIACAVVMMLLTKCTQLLFVFLQQL